MQVWTFGRTYNDSGGIGDIGSIAALFTDFSVSFGTGIERINVEPHFRSAAKEFLGSNFMDEFNRAAFERMNEAFNNRLTTLPQYRFEHSRRRLTVRYESRICSAEELLGHRLDRQPEPFLPQREARNSPELLHAFAAELRDVLKDMKFRVRKLRDFDVDAFVAWMDAQRLRMPTDAGLLYLFLDRVSQERLQERPELDEWDSLDIDWTKFHPNARLLLNDPFFWDPVDERAPHGNDEGADVLSSLQRMDAAVRLSNSALILQSIQANWEAAVAGDQILESVFERAREDALIGMAFALLKLDGQCPASIREEALSVLENRDDEDGRVALLKSALRR